MTLTHCICPQCGLSVYEVSNNYCLSFESYVLKKNPKLKFTKDNNFKNTAQVLSSVCSISE